MHINFNNDYFKIQKNNLSLFQNTLSYLGASLMQITLDNPLSAYRQFLQQYAKDSKGNLIEPKIALKKTNEIFYKYPISSSLSGLKPRIFGTFFKSIPKFSFIIIISYLFNNTQEIELIPATLASILSAPFINPIRMIEKQQRISLKEKGFQTPIKEILKKSYQYNFKPLFRGTTPLMLHSIISASTGLVGQPKLKKYIENKLNKNTNLSSLTCGFISTTILSPIYVILTNPLSRLEVVMQTNSINNKNISFLKASKIIINDTKKFGINGLFRGQGIGIAKAIFSLTVFHESRIFIQNQFKKNNLKPYS